METREIDKLKQELANELIRLRKQVSGLSEYQMAKELSMGYDSIYKMENGLSLPSRKTLHLFFTAYRMNRKEYENLVALRTKIIQLRKKDKVV
jgi:DNA-binding XRE family transcriptional regulator